jgi:valyl-tRNA synthetase
MEQYSPQNFENKHYSFWLSEKLFNSEDISNKEPFSIILPPPNVTGVLHMGHALTVTIEDIIVRYKKMNNYNVTWVPGTDHAGIATQMVVERELLKENISRHDLGRDAFIEKVWETSNKHHDIIINQLKKLGVSLDWDRERFSLDPEFNQAVNTVFIKLYEKGLVYRSEKLISWCARCGTALSDLEVNQVLTKTKLYYIRL